MLMDVGVAVAMIWKKYYAVEKKKIREHVRNAIQKRSSFVANELHITDQNERGKTKNHGVVAVRCVK